MGAVFPLLSTSPYLPPSRIIMKFVNYFLPLPLPPCPLLSSLSPPLPSLPLPVSYPPLPISTPPLFPPPLLSPQPPVYTAYASTQWWGRRLECTPSLSVSPDLSGIEVRVMVAQKVTISGSGFMYRRHAKVARYNQTGRLQ